MSLAVDPHRTKRRAFFTTHRHADLAPVPPSLVNSPYLSPNSVFRRKTSILRWPSHQEDAWLRDMVPMDRSPPASHDVDTKSEASTPSPTTADNPFVWLFPPSPLVRPRSTGPEASTPAKHAGCGPGSAHSPHS